MADTHGLIIALIVFIEKIILTNSKVLLPDANIICIIHEDCVLPCSFRPTGTVVIHWYKQQIPVHSFYYNREQFGLQNKHFSGRTCLFNAHIANGNASLLLRRVKVQDKGRYKCYTSTRKGNQEMFVNLEVKALIQSVMMEMSDEMITCSSHNIYPAPQVTWATEPPTALGLLQESTIKTPDQKGLYNVESLLRILGDFSNHTYFCSFISADKSQVWTSSWKNHDVIIQEEGRALDIPCVPPHSVQNFSLTWTFTMSSETTLIMKYDNRTKHTFNLWEGQAQLDQDLILQGDGSLLLPKPDLQQHSGTYTCTFVALQSKHTIRTRVNITVASTSLSEQRGQRSWWSTAASAGFVLFTIIIALPRCVRHRESDLRPASHVSNGTPLVVFGLQKELGSGANLYVTRQHNPGSCGQCETDDNVTDSTSPQTHCSENLLTDAEEETTVEAQKDEKEVVPSCNVEKETLENNETEFFITQDQGCPIGGKGDDNSMGPEPH